MQINLTKANKVTLEKEISELKSHLSTAERELKKLGDDMKMADLFEDTADLSIVEEGDRLEGVESTLPVTPIVDVKRENGELYVKLAHMPLPNDERKEKFGDLSYRVNVMEYEVV